jgi:HEAT repeat protein
VTYRCPTCWGEVSPRDRTCPYCGCDIDQQCEQSRYLDKLIRALRHPEPETPIRAAWILGKIGDREATSALIDAAEHSSDLFIRKAAIDALGELGDGRSVPAVRALCRDTSVLLREAATRALSALETGAASPFSREVGRGA